MNLLLRLYAIALDPLFRHDGRARPQPQKFRTPSPCAQHHAHDWL